MTTNYSISLKSADLLELLDALEYRAEVWENTVAYANGALVADEFAVVAEHKDAAEAEQILKHYQELIKDITAQMEVQQRKQTPR